MTTVLGHWLQDVVRNLKNDGAPAARQLVAGDLYCFYEGHFLHLHKQH